MSAQLGLLSPLLLRINPSSHWIRIRNEWVEFVVGHRVPDRPMAATYDLSAIDAATIERERDISLDGGRKTEISLINWDGETRCLRRKDLTDTLFATLPPTTIKFGKQLESILLDPHSTKPVLRFIDGSSIISKVVIGCDCSKSIIADFLNLKPTKMLPLCTVRGLTSYPNGHSLDHEFARFWKDNILMGIIPIDDKLVHWFCLQPYIPKDKKVWESPEGIRQLSLKLVSDHPDEIVKMIENTDMKSLSITHLRYRAPWELLTSTFCKGSVMVAGDAMHVMGPFIGQGGLAGLEDVVVLARTMAQLGLKWEYDNGSWR